MRTRLELDIALMTDSTIIRRRVEIIPKTDTQSDSEVAAFGIDLVRDEIVRMLRANEHTTATTAAGDYHRSQGAPSHGV